MVQIVENLRMYLKQRNRTTLLLFCTFALILFLKNILFHWSAFHSILISSLWHDPLSFCKFYMAKLLMPLFLSSFLFISKNRWWTIILALLIDIWCIANLIYYRINDTFLTVNDILLVGNMDGAWSSCMAYFDMSIVFLLILTILYICMYALCNKNEQREWRVFIIMNIVLIMLTYMNNYFIHNPKFWSSSDPEEAKVIAEEMAEWGNLEKSNSIIEIHYFPFYFVYETATCLHEDKSNFMKQYIQQQSIISDFIAINIYHLFKVNKTGEIIILTEENIQDINSLISKNVDGASPTNNLIIVLVESLMDWPLSSSVERGEKITPYLSKLRQQDHILYCSKIKSQALAGISGDGQMIINSGLLPIQDGVACMQYGDNIYPNLAHFYKKSAVVNPWPKIWNQDTMCLRYAYEQKIEPEQDSWEDADVLDTAIAYIQESTEPTCLLAITVSSHAPFNRVRNNKIQTKAPAILNRYMQCVNYTDSCLEVFLEKIFSDPKLSKSTIVITGDHIIFKSAMLGQFKEYAETQNLSIANGENYCPLIIYSPQISGNIQIDEVCYQMDIFPTILHLIGGDGYYWHGLGVNLLNEEARHNRDLQEQEAYRVSDLIIRSDYFRQYLHKE